VFALHVPSLPTLGPTTIGEVVLRYVSIGEQIEQHETRIPLNLNLVSSDEAAAELRSHAAGSPNAEELRRLAADVEEDLPFLEEGTFDASSSKRLHYKRNLTSQRRIQMQREEEERRKEQA
jgi:hypothetical protein